MSFDDELKRMYALGYRAGAHFVLSALEAHPRSVTEARIIVETDWEKRIQEFIAPYLYRERG